MLNRIAKALNQKLAVVMTAKDPEANALLRIPAAGATELA